MGGRAGGREGGREGGGERRREGGRERRREGEREGEKEGERGRKGEGEGKRERKRERGRELTPPPSIPHTFALHLHLHPHQNLNRASSAYHNKLAEINLWMGHNNLPSEMRERIHDYYSCIYMRHQGIDENKILDELPEQLRSDVALYQHKE